MKNTMTYAVALSTAIETIKDTMPEVAERLTALRETLAKRSQRSEDSKAKASAKRKEQNAVKRAELCAQVVPILRDVMTTDMTAKEIFAVAQERLPQDFTAAKVQAILLREMKDEVIKTETKGKANTYRLAE
jgi:hypothetical protein